MAKAKKDLFFFTYIFTPTRVKDGDTIEGILDRGHKHYEKDVAVRLLGINAPETKSKDPVEREAGLKAKKFLEDNIELGREYWLVSAELDSFGRTLGYFYPDRTLKNSLNDELLAKGLAKIYKRK